MLVFCEILGCEIDKDLFCAASGNNPLCRPCIRQEERRLELPEKQCAQNDPIRTAEKIAEQHPPRKAKIRKRCECGRGFSPKSNRQIFCPRCGHDNEREHSRERAKRFYWKNSSQGHGPNGLEPKKRNEIRVF